MKVQFDKVKWYSDDDGFWLSLRVTTVRAAIAFAKAFIAGVLHTAELFKEKKSRSLDANAYCWVLCTEIGKAMKMSKDDVYRRAISEGNEYYPLPIKEELVEDFQRRWATHGTGWVAAVVDDSKLDGYKLVFAYYGSSTYDTKQMADLIDRLIEDARALDIPILTEREISLMKEGWNAKSDEVSKHKPES